MKRKYLLLGAFSLTIFLIGITYAWWNWTSEKTNINLTLNGLNVIYTGEDNVLKGPLYPTASMTNPDNIIHPFKLRTTNNIDVYGKISLEVLEFPNELKERSFLWSLYKEDEEIVNGSFLDAEVGKDIILSPYEQILTSDTSYTLYIWIDGKNYTNPLEMGSKNFKLKLKIDASQTPYTTPEECFDFEQSTGTITNYKCDGSPINSVEDEIPIYKVLDVNACSNYIVENQIGDITALSTATSLCNENILFRELSINILLKDSDSSAQAEYMLNNNIIEPVYYDISTYKMKNVNACATYLVGESSDVGYTVDKATALCGDDRDMKEYISIVFNSKQVQYLRDNNIINLDLWTGLKTRPKITDVVIPPYINNVNVVALGNFSGKNLTGVVIPNTVTMIGDGAFRGNNLTYVIMSNKVDVKDSKKIGNCSFDQGEGASSCKSCYLYPCVN